MESRTDWPDSRISDLARRVNGMPERVATHTVEIKDLRDDVRAIRKLLEGEAVAREKATTSIRELIDSQSAGRMTSKTARTVAFIAAGGAIMTSIISSLALLVTQL